VDDVGDYYWYVLKECVKECDPSISLAQVNREISNKLGKQRNFQ